MRSQGHQNAIPGGYDICRWILRPGWLEKDSTRAELRLALAGVMDVLVFKTPGWSPTGFLNAQIALAPGAHSNT